MISEDQKIIITTKEGTPIDVPPEGSLGLLALGYKGLIAWRNARAAFNRAQKSKKAGAGAKAGKKQKNK